MGTKTDYRLKITGDRGTTYLAREQGQVDYFSGNETPLALSNLVGDDAAETRFALQDAIDGRAALRVIQEQLNRRWQNNMKLCPQCQLLA